MKKFKKVYIEITNICNKNCSFCSIDQKPKKSMTITEFEHILNEVKNYTNYIYLHVKGEPLMHNDLAKILEMCSKHEINVNITTNGTLLLEKSSIVGSFSSVRQINISLHSFEKESNIKYISNILEAVEKIQSHSKAIVVYRFWALQNNELSKENAILLNEIIKYYNLNASMIEKIKNDCNIKIANDLYINKAPLFKWPDINDEIISDKGFCYGMSQHIGILVDGTVVPCCLDSGGCINLGNIFHNSLSEILNSERSQKILNGFKNKKIEEDLCKKCKYRLRFKKNVV